MPKEEIVHSVSSILFILLVLAGLFWVLSFFFKPTKLMEKSRDAHRQEDLQDLVNATNLYLADNKSFDSLVTGQTYESGSGGIQTDGQGWVPLDIRSISSGAPLSKLPLDPQNSSLFFYRFGVDVANKTYEFDAVLEEGANQKKMLEDGGNNPARFEAGTDLTILK